MSLIPTIYRPPLGLPLYWRDEMSGRLPAAVEAYYKLSIGEQTSIAPEELDLLWDYIEHHVNAPCWEPNGFKDEIATLRSLAKKRGTLEDLAYYLNLASDIGLDPL